MTYTDEKPPLEALLREQCELLLTRHQVGRVVTIVGGAPHIVPVNYVFDGTAIVFRSDPGSTLDTVERGTVAFEIDDFDPGTRTGWSVVVRGRAEVLTRYDPPELVAATRALDVEPWASGDKQHWIRITPTTVTGRRIRQ